MTQTQESVEGLGRRCLAVTVDVRDLTGMQKMADQASIVATTGARNSGSSVSLANPIGNATGCPSRTSAAVASGMLSSSSYRPTARDVCFSRSRVTRLDGAVVGASVFTLPSFADDARHRRMRRRPVADQLNLDMVGPGIEMGTQPGGHLGRAAVHDQRVDQAVAAVAVQVGLGESQPK